MALEGVLVNAGAVTVASVTVAQNEFTVNGNLIVDDLLFLTSPLPVVGQNYNSLSGIVAFRSNDSKVEVRSSADLVPGAAVPLGFDGTSAFIRVGQSNAMTIPAPLSVKLNGPAIAPTVVTVTSSSPDLVVVGGGVTVPTGSTSAPLVLNAVNADPGVTLTLTTATGTATATVRVLGPSDVPQTVTLSPASINVALLGQVTLNVTLDVPAPAAGTGVTISYMPVAGVITGQVNVAPDQLTQSFIYSDTGTTPTMTVTATLGSSTSMTTITEASATSGHLVLNEVDYDEPGTDSAEFVEVYNPTASPIALDSIALVLVNGSNSKEYARYPLAAAGMLPAGGYLVISNGTVPAAAGALALTPTGWPMSNAIQNGPSDGMLLLDTGAGTVIDALSYDGSLTAAQVTGITGTINLVEGTALSLSKIDSNSGVASLVRAPNGQDTDNADADWQLTTTLTPGAANVVTQ